MFDCFTRPQEWTKKDEEIVKKYKDMEYLDPSLPEGSYVCMDGTVLKPLVNCECGKYLSQNWDFCPSCGKRQSSESVQEDSKK